MFGVNCVGTLIQAALPVCPYHNNYRLPQLLSAVLGREQCLLLIALSAAAVYWS